MLQSFHWTRFLPVAILAFAVGCGSSGRLRYGSPQEAFEKGSAAFEAGDYEDAIGYLRGTFDFGRTHQWAADAQLMLAASYRANKEFLLAANEYTRFSQIYRSDPRVPEAEYNLAMTYYERSPDIPLDQTDTQLAINQFRLFTTKYGQHQLVAEAQERITELREKLGMKQLRAAQQYERREYWEAAAITYEGVFDKYYDTSVADDALVGAIRAYKEYARVSILDKRQERYGKAVANYERLVQIFPESSLLKEAETMYMDIQRILNPPGTASGS